jgi:predicted N-formylglutamate amidohydrolase
VKSSVVEEAFEIMVGGEGRCPVLLTCEHASNRIPPPRVWPAQDAWLEPLHWAFDLGAAAITRQLATDLGAVAVLARFTRLLVDPNRILSSDTLFREVADGKTVALNAEADVAERAARVSELYEPFHGAIDRMMEGREPGLLLSIHSFTPSYEGGAQRPMEMGVLFDHNREDAFRLEAAFSQLGLKTALNAPYSGMNGMMFSAQSHADRHGWRALELEIRQDLSGDPTQVTRLSSAIAQALAMIQVV